MVLLANWFMFSRIVYTVGTGYDWLFKSNVRHAGSLISLGVHAIVLGNLAGYDALAYL